MRIHLLMSMLLLSGAAWCAKPNVIPALREWTDAPAGTPAFTLRPEARIVLPEEANAALERAARRFGQELGREVVRTRRAWWRRCLFLDEAARPGDITLAVKSDPKANPESYTLTISPESVAIVAPTPLGAFWGTRSLLQIFADQKGSAPAGVAKDWPDYPVRGFMFDCGRKPYSMTILRAIVNICAYYKLNDLHLHLSDKSHGLRNYPGKTALDVLMHEPNLGGFRLESNVKGLSSTDLCYSKADFRAFVDDAAAMGVRIIPEIDVPGHALSLVRVRPELMYQGKMVGKHEFERAAMLDLKNPETLPYVQSIFNEYIDGNVFPNDVVHIGTDEYFGDAETYRAFTDAMIRHIRAKGKTPRIWGSLSSKRGKSPVSLEGVQVDIWNIGWQDPQEALDAGAEIINILDGWTYVVPSGNGSIGPYGDDINAKRLYEGWAPATFGKKYTINPRDPKLLGGAWAMWGDRSWRTDPGLCGRDLLPRIHKNCATVGAKCWNAEKPTRPYEDFLAQLRRQAPTLEAEEPGAWEMTFAVTVPEGTRAHPLITSDETDLYAVSPIDGNVGYRCEGAHYTFDAKLPTGKPVTLTFRSKRHETSLLIDGKPIEGKPRRQHFSAACTFFTLPKPRPSGALQ